MTEFSCTKIVHEILKRDFQVVKSSCCEIIKYYQILIESKTNERPVQTSEETSEDEWEKSTDE